MSRDLKDEWALKSQRAVERKDNKKLEVCWLDKSGKQKFRRIR